MVIIDPHKEVNNVVIRKPVTNFSDGYTVILQHSQNRVAFLVQVEDKNINDNYFSFDLSFPEKFPFGEYTYYIFDVTGYEDYTINTGRITDSCFVISDNTIYNFNNVLINFGFPLTNTNSLGDGECKTAKLLDYGMMQRFNFEEYNSYSNIKTFVSYDKTIK